jgi:hypothetical protein
MWRSGAGADDVALTVVFDGERTTIALRQNVQLHGWLATLVPMAPGALVGYFGFKLLAIWLGFDPAHGVNEALLGIPAGAALAAGLGRWWWARKLRRVEQQLHGLFQELMSRASEALPPALPQAAAAALPAGPERPASSR